MATLTTKKVYYAHHLWKYDTAIEAWELDLIRGFFGDYEVINPKDAVKQGRPEDAIMAECLELVKECDAIVFSSLSGVVGKGVYREIETAQGYDVPVYYLHHGQIEEATFITFQKLEPPSGRIYAAVWQL